MDTWLKLQPIFLKELTFKFENSPLIPSNNGSYNILIN